MWAWIQITSTFLSSMTLSLPMTIYLTNSSVCYWEIFVAQKASYWWWQLSPGQPTLKFSSLHQSSLKWLVPLFLLILYTKNIKIRWLIHTTNLDLRITVTTKIFLSNIVDCHQTSLRHQLNNRLHLFHSVEKHQSSTMVGENFENSHHSTQVKMTSNNIYIWINLHFK